jgi:hypothetical protein
MQPNENRSILTYLPGLVVIVSWKNLKAKDVILAFFYLDGHILWRLSRPNVKDTNEYSPLTRVDDLQLV